MLTVAWWQLLVADVALAAGCLALGKRTAMKRSGPPKADPQKVAAFIARGRASTQKSLRANRKAPMTAQPHGAAECAAAYYSELPPCDTLGQALHRHHVLPRSRGGPDEPSNLIWLCTAHHQWVHEHPIGAKFLGLLE